MSKDDEVDSSLSEKPEHHHPRRLADWINPTGAKKVHSLVDKVYKRKNLELAWEKVRANRGAGGMDGESIEAFERAARGAPGTTARRTSSRHLPPAAGPAEIDTETRPAGRVAQC